MKKGKFYILRWLKWYVLKTGFIDTINGERIGFCREKNENGEVVWTSIHVETGYTIERDKTKDKCILKTARRLWLNEKIWLNF